MHEKRTTLFRESKTIYKTDDPDTLIAEFRNSLTAFNGEKKGEMEKIRDQGSLNFLIRL